MQISYMGIQSLKGSEGFRSEAYRDSGGVWTIGYGTTMIDGKPVLGGMTCTEAEADGWLMKDLAKVQTAVNQLCGNIVTQHQFDALCNFVYNEGIQAFEASTMLKKLRARDYKGAAEQFDRWVYVGTTITPGLVARRKRERALFES